MREMPLLFDSENFPQVVSLEQNYRRKATLDVDVVVCRF